MRDGSMADTVTRAQDLAAAIDVSQARARERREIAHAREMWRRIDRLGGPAHVEPGSEEHLFIVDAHGG